MSDDPLQRSAERLAARIEALAEALHAGGVSEEASAALLANASAAVLQALMLEVLVDHPELADNAVVRLGGRPLPVFVEAAA